MKCQNCNLEINQEINFCPNCGAKLNENISSTATRVTKQKLVQVTNKDEMFTILSVLGLYSGIGMALVSLFFAFKGFGLFADKSINYVTVWVTFGVSIALAVTGALFYFLKFRNRNK